MAVTRRPRGATVVQNEQEALSGLNIPRKYLLGSVTIAALFALGIFISSPNNEAVTSPVQLVASPHAIEEQEAGPGPDHEQVVAEEILPPPQPWLDQVVKRGDNLSLIFKRAGYNDRDVHRVVSQSRDGKLLERIYPGQTIAFQANHAGALAAVRYTRSQLETVTYRHGEEGFESLVETRSPELREAWATGIISSSLFLAGQEAGLSQNLIMEMANIFGGVIDFVLDPRQGDTIQLIYEELFLDGEPYQDGEIIAASFTNQGETFNAFRYQDSSGDVNYYNENGVSMRKAFLLAPVDFSRISSNFNLRRLHPIYKTTRPHRGTDYAASRGTPVYAAGDGRVSKAGYSKSNGNYVFIQHGEQYVTKYLHLHKRKVKSGQRVSQSQVIGTVGSTGAATGPHLHYEFLMNGVHRNPRTIHKKLPKAKSLPESEMPRFRQAINEASTQLAALRSDNHLAMRDSASATNSTN